MSITSAITSLPTKLIHIAGFELSVRILLGATIVWFIVERFAHRDPLWAMISVVIVSDTELNASLTAFRGRVLNTLTGCAIGLLFLWTLGPQSWSILLAMAVAVMLSSNFALTVTAWRIAPVTVVIVMMPSLVAGSRTVGTPIAIMRAVWVLLGSAVAVLVSLMFAVLRRARQRVAAAG